VYRKKCIRRPPERGRRLRRLSLILTVLAHVDAVDRRVEALEAGGRVIYQDSFDPKFVIRPVFDQFTNYEKVRVTTGWLNAVVDGSTVTDERIPCGAINF
jgi:hypothetical protein